MSGVRGDFTALSDLRSKLASIADGSFKRTLSVRLGAEAVKLVSDGFREQRNPYGKDWKPSGRALTESGQTLRDKGRLLTSLNAQPTTEGFEIGTDVKYAAIHQYGGVIRRKSGLLAFNKKGRFISKRKAASLKRGAIAIRRHDAYEIRIPQRQFIPMESTGGLGWRFDTAFKHETKIAILDHFGTL